MIWGCFSAAGVGPLVKINGNMDSQMYSDILEQHMLPHAKSIMNRGWVFQHDNDPKHRFTKVQEWFNFKKVKAMPWPSQSPDANPIEHMSNPLKKRTASIRVRNAEEKFALLQKSGPK
ncbi:hypothetical protein WR25_13457 [Diploscapter pachys]|uniref:Tc1-like transposase DDE domain-containing protein n=1 Tax=Diploscapter pachys TaxID=2018661 RepID=A0A2A2KGN1_9BILA|nr:hypothetical protein WR25_13457 [Diploscapter pachys]